MDNIIGPFRNEYSFLSNMYSCQVTIEGMGTFTCAEAAFQACKCTNQEDMKSFFGISGREAKKLGRKINCRTDWDNVRVDMMRKVVQAKFTMPELADKLIATGDEELVEINTWNDKFWGAVYEDEALVGENNLGKILMAVRAELQEKKEKENNIMETNNNKINITTNVAIRADGKTFAIARIAGFNCIQNLVWDEKDAAATGIKIAKNFDGTYTQDTMKNLQYGYLAHLRKNVSALKGIIVNTPCTLVAKPFQAGPLAYALEKLNVEVKINTTNKLPMIGCGRVKGSFKGGVSNSVKGGMASAILLPYEGYNFDPKKDPCWEVHGVVGVNGKAKLGFFIFVAAEIKEAARDMIRSWIDREVGKDAKVYTDKNLCKEFDIYGCFQRVASDQGFKFLNMAFECEHLDGPQFVFAKETVDMNSCADIMALLQSKDTRIAALEAKTSEQETRIEKLEKQLAQLQVLLMNGNSSGSVNNGSGNSSTDGKKDCDGDNNGSKSAKLTIISAEPGELKDADSEPEPKDEQPKQEEPAPKQPAKKSRNKKSPAATAITQKDINAVSKFLSFANDEVQEDDLCKATDEEKQKAETAKQEKVKRALEAVKVLNSTPTKFNGLVKKAKLDTIYDIKVDNGEVFINQEMFIEDWKKISIENNNLIVSC